MKYGWIKYKREFIGVNGSPVVKAVTYPCEIHSMEDGQVTFKAGGICKRGSYPNIHKYLNTKDSDVTVLPLSDVEIDLDRPLWK